MGTTIMSENRATGYKEFTVETTNELSTLDAKPGNAALCLANSKVYIKKYDGTWKEL